MPFTCLHEKCGVCSSIHCRLSICGRRKHRSWVRWLASTLLKRQLGALLNWHEHGRGLRSSVSAHDGLVLVFVVHTVAGMSDRGSCAEEDEERRMEEYKIRVLEGKGVLIVLRCIYLT